MGRLLVRKDGHGNALAAPLGGAKVWVVIELVLVMSNTGGEAALIGRVSGRCRLGEAIHPLDAMCPAHNTPVTTAPVQYRLAWPIGGLQRVSEPLAVERLGECSSRAACAVVKIEWL